MSHRVSLKTTFEQSRVLEPIYTGGSVALSSDGRILASCVGEDVVLTDLQNGHRLAKIEGDGEIVTSLSLTPSASHLIICSRSHSTRIFSLGHPTAEGVSLELLRTLKPHNSPVVTSATDSTGSLLATGAADGLVKVWDIQGGFTTHTLHGHSGVISALRFFNAGVGKHARSDRNREQIQTLRRHDEEDAGQGDAVGFRLVSGDEEGKIRIWHLQKRKCIAVLESHVSVVRSFDFAPEEELLVSASRDKTMILWDTSTWKIRKIIPVLEGIEAAGFLKQRQLLYTGGETGNVRLWWSTGQEATEKQKSRSEGQSIIEMISNDSLPFVLSVHADQTLLFHSLLESFTPEVGPKVPPLTIARRISGTHDEVIDLAFVGGGNEFLAVATNIEEIRLLSLSSSDTAMEETSSSIFSQSYFGADVGVLQGHEDIIICLDVDWSGHWIATGSKDNTARLWKIDGSTSSFTCIATFTGHAESLGAIALPKTQPLLGSAAYRRPLDHTPPFLLTGSQDKTIKRWDTSSLQKRPGRATYTRKAHDKDINALDISPDSKLFASASQDRTVKIWSSEDGEAVGILRGHKRGVWSAKFAPYNTPAISSEGGVPASSSRGLLLTGSGDKTLKVWSLVDYSCIRTFEGHTNSVLKVAWINPPQSNDENRDDDGEADAAPVKRTVQVASAGGDGLVKVWDASSGELECTLDNHTDRVWALTVHPHTNMIISGGGDSVITFWRDTTSETVAASAAASNERIEQDQQLQNYIRAGSYRSAITLALQLNHPARLLALFTSVVSTYPPEEGSLCGVKAVDEVLANLSDGQLYAMLLRVRDWNANAKTAPVAQKVFWALLKSYPAARFTKLKPATKGGPNVAMLMDGLKAYTERHYNRIEELIDESYLVDYTLQEMDEISGIAIVTNGTKSHEASQKDVEMLD